MSFITSSNHTPISHLNPSKCLIRSNSDLQRLIIRRSQPFSIDFRLEGHDKNSNISSRKIFAFTSKKLCKLKNPPVKQSICNRSLTRHLKSLQLRPEDAAKYIPQITRRFSKIRHLAIIDEEDSFYPMRVKKKVHPIRSLKSFVYDHEFSHDFMRCARYASDIKIRKTAVNFEQLERCHKLENIYLVLKTRYLSLPEEDQKFTCRLGKALHGLPALQSVILEQEINHQNNPYTFMELSNTLNGKANVKLVADFVDASFHKHRDLTIEKVMHKIHQLGIQSLKVNYAGVVRVMKRFERVFEAPIHTREDIYIRFIKAIMDMPFKEVEFLPTVHSSHIDLQLTESLVELLKVDNGIKVPELNLMYNLDIINPSNLDLFLDLYNNKANCYNITVISTGDFRKSLTERIKEHFAAITSKIEEANTAFSLTLAAKNLNVLMAMIKTLGTKMNSSMLKSLNIQVIEPVHNQDFENFLEILRMSDTCKVINKIQLDFVQKGAPSAQDLIIFLSSIAKDFIKLNKIKLCYSSNTRDGTQVFKNVFRSLRKHRHKVDFAYEINNERIIYE